MIYEFGQSRFDLPAPVYKSLDLGHDLRVVLLDYGKLGKQESKRNAYLLRRDGTIAWQVEAYEPNAESPSTWTGIWLDEAGKLWMFNFIGVDAEIALETGRIIRTQHVR